MSYSKHATGVLCDNRNAGLDLILDLKAIGALSSGNISDIEDLRLRGILVFNHATMLVAAEHNQIEVMKWLHRYGCGVYDHSAEGAIANGHTEAIKLLYDWGCRFTWRSAGLAAEYNQFETLKLLTSLGAFKTHHTASNLAMHDNFDNIMWTLNNGYRADNVWNSAAAHGQLDVLIKAKDKIPREGGILCRMMYYVYCEAKDNRHVNVMRWIRDNMFDAGISDGSWGPYFVNTINKDIEEIEK